MNTSGHITPEAAAITHSFMEKYIGTDQSEFGVPGLSMTRDIRSEPPILACSDEYTEFVRAQKINIIQGRMKGFSAETNSVDVRSFNFFKIFMLTTVRLKRCQESQSKLLMLRPSFVQLALMQLHH